MMHFLSWGVASVSFAMLIAIIVVLIRRDHEEREYRRKHKLRRSTDRVPFHDDLTTQGGLGD